MNTKSKRNTANVLFLFGVLVTMALAGLMAWAAFEGLSYFATGAGYPPYGGMHCPILMSSSETGVVQAEFSNPTDQAAQPYYEVEISGIVQTRKVEGQITVPPSETRSVTWTVSAADVDLQPFVFVKMDVLPIGGNSTREDTCGILVAGLGGMPGTLALSISIALGVLCILIGMVLPAFGLTRSEAAQFDGEASSNARRAGQALSVACVCALLAGLIGWWLVATLLLAISVLLLLTVLAGFVFAR